ncbi:hypothetical protein [Anaerobacterium chartisolvens]|uniref:hypothetical protein n=1 Tax=Anaerobacterium chartisolvens TaxID=1297424 RepID=UPI000DF1F7CA|nr:hypothetical protein [Anaerobacterium chartisolvens]
MKMQILTPLLSSPHIEGKKKKGTGEENEKNNAGACKAASERNEETSYKTYMDLLFLPLEVRGR